MNKPKHEAGLRANDPVELEETIAPKDQNPPKPRMPVKSDIEEASAESGPELREIIVDGKKDRPDGRK